LSIKIKLKENKKQKGKKAEKKNIKF
jgi:hypothetical protein